MPKKSHKKLLRNGKGSGKKSQRGNANRSNSTQQLSMMKGGAQILEYKVFIQKFIEDLEEEVNKELKNGWKPCGGTFYDNINYGQAMTIEKETET